MLGFYLPLVLTSQMMTLSNPLINLRLSRSADPQMDFAAYGVCFGLTVFLNAPMLVSRDVGAGLAESRGRFHRLLRHTFLLGLLITALDLVLALTVVGDWAFGTLLESTPRVTERAQEVALGLSPIPLLVGVRGLASALVMRAHLTRLLTEATALRLTTLVLVLFFAPIEGALVGAVALSAGIFAECVWISIRARGLFLALPSEEEFLDRHGPQRRPPRFGDRTVARFAMPLVLSALAWTAMRPVINGILGRTADSEAAQASFGILHPVVLLAASALWALQATAQILVTNRARARPFLRFGITMTVLCSAGVFLLGWVPSWRQWLLTEAFTLPPNLLEYVRPAMRILFLAPLLLGMRACFKGMILATRNTTIISFSAALDLAAVFTVGSIALALFPSLNGAVLGIMLVITAELVETSMLGTSVSRRYGLQRNLPEVEGPVAAPDEEGRRP